MFVLMTAKLLFLLFLVVDVVFSAVAWSGGAFNHFTSKLLAAAMKEGLLQKHLITLRKEYGVRLFLSFFPK